MRELNPREEFLKKYYASESELFEWIRERAREQRCDHMIVSPSEARTLQFMVELSGARRIVEIGTLYGLSCLSMVQASGVEKIWTLEKKAENAKMAQEHFNKSQFTNKIELILGDAKESLGTLSVQSPFDLVFIDADKSGYPWYLNWAHENLKVGGIVICDNTFLAGSVWGESVEGKSQTQIQAMLSVHNELAFSGKWSSHTLPSFDGLSIGIKL